MKLRRATDKIGIFIWIICLIAISLVFIDTSIKTILLQVCLVTLQLLLVFIGAKAFDKRHKFSYTIADQIYDCLNKNMIPTSKAIESAKEDLRRSKCQNTKI